MRYIKVYVTVTARNVLFSKRTEDFLKGLQDRAANINVKKYIKSNLRNWLINSFKGVKRVNKAKSSDPDWLKAALERGEDVYNLSLSSKDMETISHWVDYLNTLNGDISRISIPQLEKKVKEWEESFAKQKADEEDGIELVHRYSDGFSWVRVFGKDSLNREGKLMNHCVGSYYKQVEDGYTSIYSLRDKSNKPHCTIELSRNKIEQIKGNSNKPVKEEYKKYILDFVEKKYVKFDKINSSDLMVNLELIENGGKLYDVNRLPKNFKIRGDLDLSNTKITSLPEGLNVGGDLIISRASISELPKGLKVGGDLLISETNISELPEGLEVGGDLGLNYSQVTSLPEDLKVGYSLELAGTNISMLPKSLKFVKGDLNLEGSDITSLPEGLKVRDNLYLMRSKITSLPDNLEVGENLYLQRSKITSLPKGLKVGMQLHITDTKITEIPEDIQVGSIYATRMKFTSVP